jgi:Tfp pilus assembly protein PilF
LRTLVITVVLLTATLASAQTPTIDLGSDVSTLTRYRVYPHLQRGLEAVESGDETVAISELEHARRLAPDNAAVAMYLATAYRRFDHADRARELLRDQLTKTPGEARVTAALLALTPPPAAPATAAPLPRTADAVVVPPEPEAERIALEQRRLADAHSHAALGFTAWNAGDSKEAERAFELSWQLDPSSLVVTSQLVYVHQRLAHNQRAREFAERTIDALASAPPATAPDSLTTAERTFQFARLHEELGRRLTISVDGFSGSGGTSATSAAAPGQGFRSYAQVEADVRLGRTPIRNGASVSLYARVFSDGGAANMALPTENPTIGAGVRWKPLGNRVFFVMAEGQHAPSVGTHDVLLRGSLSLFGGGGWSDDWHPSGSGWFSRNLYLDTAYYAISKRVAVTGDYRMSYHRRLGGRQTVEPYARVQVNGFRDSVFNRDIRVGVGARWNLWHGESRYDAFRHKWAAGIEFQHALDTYLPGRSGVFLSVGVRR